MGPGFFFGIGVGIIAIVGEGKEGGIGIGGSAFDSDLDNFHLVGTDFTFVGTDKADLAGTVAPASVGRGGFG